MPRPIHLRRVALRPPALRFEPVMAAGSGDGRPPVLLGLDEAEALRLADVEGLYQEAIAARLGVSRATAGRIVESARRAVATAICEGRPLQLLGGSIAICAHPAARCPVHGGPRRAGRRCRCGPGAGAGAHAREASAEEREEMEMNAGTGYGRGQGRGHGHQGIAVLPGAERELGAEFRIAVPTTDGVHVSEHLGRSARYVIAEIKDFTVVGMREIAVGGGGRGAGHGNGHGSGRGAGCGAGRGAGRHHRPVTDALRSVDVVLIGGAGRRILEDLVALGVRIEPAEAETAEAAIAAFLTRLTPDAPHVREP